MGMPIPFFAAFVAGLLSIASPCVLPLVPLYLTHLAGVSVDGSGAVTPARGRVLVNATAYVLGFSTVFVLLGVALGAAGSLVATASVVAGGSPWLIRVGGALLVFLGLSQLGLVRLPWLNRERRIGTGGLPVGHVGSSFLIGATFAAGWSPCVGPILGAILTMAAGQGDIETAALLLAVYSAGLAVPFFLVALFGSTTGVLKALTRRLPIVTGISGGVMLATGAVMLLGLYQQFFARLVALAPWQPWEPRL